MLDLVLGNYAEAVGEDTFASLRESYKVLLRKINQINIKLGVEFNEETGIGRQEKMQTLQIKWTNMMRTRFNFRKDQLAAKNRLDAQIKNAAEEERKAKEAHR